MAKKVAIILINYKDYAQKYLPACLASLNQQQGDYEWRLFIVDNASTPDSYDYLKIIAPEAKIILNQHNDGFAKGNNDAIKMAQAENFNYIFLLNMDTEIEPQALQEMLSVLEADQKIGAVQARLMMWPEKDQINSLGNTSHFLGFGYCLGYRDKYQNHSNLSADIFYPSGAAVLLRSKVLAEVGLFDEEYWMYNEDQDLGWRLWLGGFRCVVAWRAVVYHKYEFNRSITKYFWMDRNRTITIIKNYAWPTLILIFPAWFIMEFGLLIFSLQSHWFKERRKVIGYFFKPTTWLYLRRARKHTQSLRKIKDWELMEMISGRIWYQEIDDPKLRLINPFFSVYFWFVKGLARLFKF